MKVFLTGAGGQLGRELQDTVPADIELIALDREQCDISNRATVEQILAKTTPDLIINAAAYTAVDKAEQEQAAAFAINHLGIENLAKAAAKLKTKIIHVSTDFVFDGRQNRPYQPDDPPHPQSVYGASKLAGEQALLDYLPDNHILIRTSWVYSAYGHNFVKTMLRLMQDKDELGIVADQIGSPTWANGLARTIWAFANRPEVQGLFHWSDAGVASWYDFAVAIQREGLAISFLGKPIMIKPITTQDYPTPATRPAFSVLNCTKTRQTLELPAVHWQTALQSMMARLTDQ